MLVSQLCHMTVRWHDWHNWRNWHNWAHESLPKISGPERHTIIRMTAAATLDTAERPMPRAAVGQPLSREQLILSLPQAQAALGGIGLTLLYKLIDSGSIQRVKIGRRAFVTQASINAFIASLPAA